jgi:CBS domain-containing protein
MRIDQVTLQAVVSCAVDTRVSTVRAMLSLNESDGLLLMDGGMVIGCVDRHDLKRQGLDVAGAQDRQAIGPYAHGCSSIVTGNMDVQLVLTRMQRSATPLLPVRENGRLVGMVSTALLAASLV